MTSTDIISTLANCRMWRWHVYRHTWCDRGDQSLHGSTLLVKWEYTLIKSMCCEGQSPPSAVANNLTTKVNNNTKCSLCPQKDVLNPKMKVPKDTHTPALMPLSCFPFNSAIGSDKHSKICYALLTKNSLLLHAIAKPLTNGYGALHITYIYS